jgi:hypothetical protein
MRLMFVYNMGKDIGSAQTILNYGRVAKALGHEVVVYRRQTGADVASSLDIESADVVVFVLESWLDLDYAGHLNLVRLMSKIPKERRVAIDNDGMYNDVIRAGGDYNHSDLARSRACMDLYESISDMILQPTLHPLRPKVRSFLFHGYNPAWEVPLDFRDKQYGMFYVGNNWFRWQAMKRVLQAVYHVRDEVGGIGIVGYAWDPPAYWLESTLRQEACYTDPRYLEQLAVQVMPAVHVDQVVDTMSKGIFNPVLVRPLFNELRLVNPRLFETPAANTIPLFGLDHDHVREIYGDEALELVLPQENPEEKIRDVVCRPERYVIIVECIRRHLAETHSYERRLTELIGIVNS